jgi:competence protein ComEC
MAPQKIQSQPAITASELIFWDVGQGDYISLNMSSAREKFCAVFDVGGSRPLNRIQTIQLLNRCKGSALLLYLSHFDQDHIRNFESLIRQTRISKIFVSHLKPETETGRRFLKSAATHHVPVEVIQRGHAHSPLSSLKIKCLWPPPDRTFKTENSKSLVLLVEAGSKKILLTGDLPCRFEKEIPAVSAAILKVGHHGSKTSSCLPFLKRVAPKTCIISAGKKNRYRHPSPATLRRLEEISCATLRTDRLGNLRILL